MEAAFRLFTSLILCFLASSAFTPEDNYLITCGSNASSVISYNREFVGDSSKNGSIFLMGGNSNSLKNPNPTSNSSPLHRTARFFTSPSRYEFNMKSTGIHLIRLHFDPFVSGNYDLRNGSFGVVANGFSLLNNFTSDFTVIREFFFMVDKVNLEIVFIPSSASSFAFINAIEVFSAPTDFFIEEGAIILVTPYGIQEFKQNISSQIMETVHRINVGGSKLTPFNDTLWRYWIPDDNFLTLKSAAKLALSTDLPNYLPGGATRETAPDNVYMTAQQMNRDNGSANFLFNISWEFPIKSEDSMHLVRLHFCDIVSIALNSLYFNVYINGITAYKDVDLSVLALHKLAAPYYIDFAVENKESSDLMRISVGPSDLSNTMRKNAILNGVEIMRMVDYVALPKKTKKKRLWVLVGSIVGGFSALVFVVGAICLLVFGCKKKKPKARRTESAGWGSVRGSSYAVSEGTALASPGPYGYYGLKIPFVDIQSATNDFDQNLVIGSGGFGMVYKGILKENIKVAVKRGVPGSKQGIPEFQTEISILSKIRHLHLVSLVGYCEEQSEMILVYEYMEKGPLRHHLYGSSLPPLTWKQRLEICIGAARGLHYLHTGSAQGIIHRDIKSTNILLDDNYVAKVADFGLSRSGPCIDETHVSTGVKGSFGYLDPEYFRRQQLTDKSDVYSFGVVLFEVLCARPAVDPLLNRERVNLAEWAIEWQKKGLLEQIVDSRILDQIKPTSLKKFGETAEKCLADYGVDRPTMGDVLWNLEHSYQLQTSEPRNSTEDNNSDENGLQRPVPGLITSHNGHKVDSSGQVSDISTTRVFSQLLNSEGR